MAVASPRSPGAGRCGCPRSRTSRAPPVPVHHLVGHLVGVQLDQEVQCLARLHPDDTLDVAKRGEQGRHDRSPRGGGRTGDRTGRSPHPAGSATPAPRSCSPSGARRGRLCRRCAGSSAGRTSRRRARRAGRRAAVRRRQVLVGEERVTSRRRDLVADQAGGDRRGLQEAPVQCQPSAKIGVVSSPPRLTWAMRSLPWIGSNQGSVPSSPKQVEKRSGDRRCSSTAPGRRGRGARQGRSGASRRRPHRADSTGRHR